MHGEGDRGDKRKTEYESTANNYRLWKGRLGKELDAFSMVPTHPVRGRGTLSRARPEKTRAGVVPSAGRPKGSFRITANVNIEHVSAMVKKPIRILTPPNRTTRRSRLDPLVLKRTDMAGTKKRVAPNEQPDGHVRPVRTMRGPRHRTPDTGNPNNRNLCFIAKARGGDRVWVGQVE